MNKNLENFLTRIFGANSKSIELLKSENDLTDEEMIGVMNDVSTTYVEPNFKSKFTDEGHKAAYGRSANEARQALIKLGVSQDEVKDLPFAELLKKFESLKKEAPANSDEAKLLKTEIDNLKATYAADLEAEKKRASDYEAKLKDMESKASSTERRDRVAKAYDEFSKKNNLKAEAKKLFDLFLSDMELKGNIIDVHNGSFVIKDKDGKIISTPENGMKTIDSDFITEAKSLNLISESIPPQKTNGLPNGTQQRGGEEKNSIQNDAYAEVLAKLG